MEDNPCRCCYGLCLLYNPAYSHFSSSPLLWFTYFSTLFFLPGRLICAAAGTSPAELCLLLGMIGAIERRSACDRCQSSRTDRILKRDSQARRGEAPGGRAPAAKVSRAPVWMSSGYTWPRKPPPPFTRSHVDAWTKACEHVRSRGAAALLHTRGTATDFSGSSNILHFVWCVVSQQREQAMNNFPNGYFWPSGKYFLSLS